METSGLYSTPNQPRTHSDNRPGTMPWQEVKGEDGSIYYFNEATNETSWDKPEELFGDVDKAVAGTGWKRFFSEDGGQYWFHEAANKSVWETPAEVQVILDDTVRATVSSGQDESKDVTKNLPEDEALVGFESKSKLAPQHDIPGFDEDAQSEAFSEALTSLDLSFGADWKQCLPQLVKQGNYWWTPDPYQRKVRFDRHHEELVRNQKQELRLRKEDARAAMYRQLEKYTIEHYTRWKTIKPQLENDPVFSIIENEKEKLLAFRRVLKRKQAEHTERLTAARKESMATFENLLLHSELHLYSEWRDVRSMAEQSAASKLDSLKVFEKFIRTLERQNNEQKQAERAAEYRQIRKGRDAFKALLKELQQERLIEPGTRWRSIVSTLEKDERYTSICGQPGSTPIELFWDVLESQEREIKKWEDAVLDFLATSKRSIEACADFAMFKDIVKDCVAVQGLLDNQLQHIYNRLQQEVARKREADRLANERRLRRAQDGLRHEIKHLEPPIRLDDSWEAVGKRLADSDAYRDIKDDSIRRAVFEAYMQKLNASNENTMGQKANRGSERGKLSAQPRGLDEGPYMDY